MFLLVLRIQRLIPAGFEYTSWRKHINRDQFFQAYRSSKVAEIDVEEDRLHNHASKYATPKVD
jgi:hypothetical protein